ncbi:MAG: sulfotransferase family 2 domain-containing protein [Actinomycetes bacterium]
MIVSHEHRFIFLKTRKTAGTSVEIALSRICGPEDIIAPITETDEELRKAMGGRPPQNYTAPPLEIEGRAHMPASAVRRIVGTDVWDSYFKFAIERNPWDAVVSLYFWRTRENPSPAPFEDFVNSDEVPRWAAKNARIYRLQGKVAVDQLCRFESLDSDLDEVWSSLGLPGTPDLPRAKGDYRPREARYPTMYTPATAERVGDIFASMTAEFGYRFEPPSAGKDYSG